MEGKFLINNQSVVYLIHGQPFQLEYQTEGCWFVIISYNDGSSFFKKLFFRKPNGIFQSVTNVYSPEIKLWGVKWGFKKLFHHFFHINFINTREQKMKVRTPELPQMPEISIHFPKTRIMFPKITKSPMQEPRLMGNYFNINTYDDYEGFKQSHPSSQTIQ